MKILLVQFLLILLNFSQIIGANLSETDTIGFQYWGGNTNQFLVDDSSGMVQLNGNQNNKEASLFCKSDINSGKWSFKCKMEFNPSSQNYCELLLAASDTIIDETSGFSVLLGKNSDRVELVKYKNGERSVLIQSNDGFLNMALVDIAVSVERNDFGEWRLKVDRGRGMEEIGVVIDPEIFDSNYFIVRCQYTSTRSNKFYFSELNGVGSVQIAKAEPELRIVAHDIVFTEFMSDPFPSVNLPEVEYIELYNRSSKAIPLSRLAFYMGGSTYRLPLDTIFSHEYLVLAGLDGAGFFRTKGRALGMSGFPTLSNSGFTIFLKDTSGAVIDAFHYLPTDYSGFKTDGGWSIERKNIADLAYSSDNWSFSVCLDGGTPAARNSISLDSALISASKLINVCYLNDSVFRFDFSKGMFPSPTNMKIFSSPLLEIKSGVFVDSLYRILDITMKAPIDTNFIYSIDSISGFYDANKFRVICNNRLQVGKPHLPKNGDLWINEILFDAGTEGGEFIELYNSSNNIMETSSLRIKYNNGSYIKVSDFVQSIMPNGFILLFNKAHSPKNMKIQYENCLLSSISDFPQLSNEGGTISLYLLNGICLDSVVYNSNLHHPSIINREDVSLERNSFLPVEGSSCWSSASSGVHFSTPGFTNSSAPKKYMFKESDAFIFPSDFFSPNHDGFLDRFEMVRGDGYENAVVTAKIFSTAGRLVNSIAENVLIFPNEVLYWNGLGENGVYVEPGIYIALLSGYNPQGKSFSIKKAIVLAPK